MWKEVLKIDMDEARRLGEKYAPEDMEEASLNRNMVNTGKEIKRHTKIFKDIKKLRQSYIAFLDRILQYREKVKTMVKELQSSMNIVVNSTGKEQERVVRTKYFSRSLVIIYTLQTTLDFEKGQKLAAKLFQIYER